MIEILSNGLRINLLSVAMSDQSIVYHIPALLEESIAGLNIVPDGTYVDVTFGGGGHSRAVMSHLGKGGRLYGFDQDMDAYANRIDDPRFTFVHGNFAYLKNFLRYYGVEEADGIIADLGVSFHHFDDASRGFSFRADAPLDMRMNREGGRSAADLLADATEEQIADWLFNYGELKQARRMAGAIVKSRAAGVPVGTVGRLLDIVKPYIKPSQEKKELAQVFQALRIAVNDELGALRSMLVGALQVLRPGGRLVVITYHSLEDRLVKNFIKSGNVEGKIEKDFYGRVSAPFKAVNNKVIQPGEDEVERNPRSRSAKLRIAEKI